MKKEFVTLEVSSLIAWRNWLKKNHKTEKEIWLIFTKNKATKAFSYDESVKEALCYGWIDSLIKKIDEVKYARKFTPRINNNKWSPSNIQRMKKLIESGRMTKAGSEKFDISILNSETEPQKIKKTEAALPADLEKILRKNKTAWNNFKKLAPSYRKIYIGWITYPKKEETQLSHLYEAIAKLEKGEKLGLK
jgi:uncharacterized protein YdeI (YjbR/CyaY-like superfamily)